MPSALTTDLYELTMAVSYLRRGMAGPATFSLFVRHLPRDRGFLVCAGVESALDFLGGFRFHPDEIFYLAGALGLRAADREALAALRFTGDVWAVPEGRVVTAGEPLVEVTAPIAEAQLVETALLNYVTFQTAVASKAARCRLAARGADLVDFALRRTQGIEAGMQVARLSAMVGFAATSNTAAAREFGLVPAGTMAHSYVQAFPDEASAFRSFAEDFPDRSTFLVDTFDTPQGVRTAARLVRELALPPTSGVRLDSGDLAALAGQARDILDAAGLPQVRIFASGGLDEFEIAEILARGAPVDAFGVGTKLGVSADAPYLDTAYKLVCYAGRPVFKLSPGKATLPGAKQVFRQPGRPDLIGLRGQAALAGSEELLVPVMAAGRRTGGPDPLAAARARFEHDLAALPAEATRLREPVPLPAALTDELRDYARRAGAAPA